MTHKIINYINNKLDLRTHIVPPKLQSMHYFQMHSESLPKLTICWTIKYFNKFTRLVIDTSLISMKLGDKKIIRKKYIRNIRIIVLNNWFKEGLNKI